MEKKEKKIPEKKKFERNKNRNHTERSNSNFENMRNKLLIY